MAPRAAIALLTDRRYTASEAAAGDWYLGNILADDRLLAAALAARGLASVRLDWADEQIDWGRFARSFSAPRGTTTTVRRNLPPGSTGSSRWRG